MKLSLLFNYLILLVIMACATNRRSQKEAAVVNILPRSTWNAAIPQTYKTHTPIRITVHHEGTRFLKTDNAPKKIAAIQKWGMGPDRKWADIPYHFLIAPDGTIYEGRAVNSVGETNTEYDPTGHLLITCLGNYNEQEVSPEVLDALTRLIAYCSKIYKIPLNTLSTHRDQSKQTTCPGNNLYRYFEDSSILKQAYKLQ